MKKLFLLALALAALGTHSAPAHAQCNNPEGEATQEFYACLVETDMPDSFVCGACAIQCLDYCYNVMAVICTWTPAQLSACNSRCSSLGQLCIENPHGECFDPAGAGTNAFDQCMLSAGDPPSAGDCQRCKGDCENRCGDLQNMCGWLRLQTLQCNDECNFKAQQCAASVTPTPPPGGGGGGENPGGSN